MEMRKSVLAIVTILVVVVSMLAAAHIVNALQSVSEGSTNTTITLNESVDFWIDVKPSSRIKWYCDNVLVKSEYSLHSNYTFRPEAMGTYMIQLSVDGFTSPMGPKEVTVTAETMPSPTPTQAPQPSVIRYYNDTHFAFNRRLSAFSGYQRVSCFTARANDYLEFNIVSTNSDPNRPNDVYIVRLMIESANHNLSFVTGTSFNQKVILNYTDSYNISIAKSPFYATVTVNGTIDLHRNDLATPTSIPSSNPTLQPTINTSVEPQKTEPFPSVLIVVVSVVAVALIVPGGLLLYHKKHKHN
jgi:hypothetical protein